MRQRRRKESSVKDGAGPEKLEEISGVKYGEGVEEARRGEACSSERKAGGKDRVVGTMGICKRAAVKGQWEAHRAARSVRCGTTVVEEEKRKH